MLEDYLAFARGDSGEHAQPTDMTRALEELRKRRRAQRPCRDRGVSRPARVTVKPASFKRCLANLVSTRRVTPTRFRSPAIAITVI